MARVRYIFNTSKCAATYDISFEVYDGFEAMKAGKLAIWPWLSCPYDKNTHVDLPSSVCLTIFSSEKQKVSNF